MSTNKISIVSVEMVKPVGDPAHTGTLYTTAWDNIFGGIHVKTIHFYTSPPPQPMMEILRGSMGRALAHFSPFAGRLRWAGPRMEIDCNGEGAELVEAECEEEMISFRDLNCKRLSWLVPVVDGERPVEEAPLLLVQLTRFCCGGVSVGVSMAHAVADGQSAFHFFSEWARLARGEQLKEAPHLDRTFLKGRVIQKLSSSDHIEFESPPQLLGKQDSVEEQKKEVVKILLPLTKAQLDTLKMASKNHNDDQVCRNFSRFEVIAAHIWRCACKARRHKNEQSTTMSIAIDVSKRICSIPFPPRYFGNMTLSMRVKSRAGELGSNPLGFVCEKIREGVKKVDEDYIWSNLELLEEKKDLSCYGLDSHLAKVNKPFYGNPNLRITSWLSLPFIGMDFGWGNKVEMIPMTRDIDGSGFVMPGLHNDGSVVVLLCLQLDHVDDFKNHFYEDIHE